MHILIVSHNYPFPADPAFGFFCRQQAEALQLAGHKVGVICPLLYSIPDVAVKKRTLPLGLRQLQESGIGGYLFFFPSPPRLKRLKHYIMERIGAFLLRKYVRHYGVPDIIHLHVFYASRVALLASQLLNRPVVWTEHFSDIDNLQLALADEQNLQIANRLAAIRIAVSENFRRNLERKLGTPFHYVPNVYNERIFRYDPAAPKRSEFTFIHVANLNPNKNQARLLRAFELAFGNQHNVKLVIIGDGEDCSALQQLIHSRSLNESVVMMGFLAAEQIYQEMAKSHAVVISSNYETFGVSLIEGMACGLPAIATKCGGPESIINSEALGLLAEKTDESLAASMKFIFDNYSRYSPTGIAENTRRRFGYMAIAEQLTNLYQACN